MSAMAESSGEVEHMTVAKRGREGGMNIYAVRMEWQRASELVGR